MSNTAFTAPVSRLIAATVLAFSFGAPAAQATDGDRPNILFIYTDDHSYRTVGAYPQACPHPWQSRFLG